MRAPRSLVLAVWLATLAAPWSSARASPVASLTLRGASQGDIKGGATQKGREGSLRVLAVSHTLTSPRDPASGLPTGKRQHRPIVLTVELDRAAPLLYRALVTHEKLSEVVVRFYAPASKPGALELNSHTLRLVSHRGLGQGLVERLSEVRHGDGAPRGERARCSWGSW